MAQAKHISLGRLGEDIVADYLLQKGYRIIDRNYSKKWGELDIVAKKGGVLYFIEVKAGSWKKEMWPKEGEDVHRPEDHMNARKHACMRRVIASYLREHPIECTEEWEADLAVVLVNATTQKVLIRWVKRLLFT